jgi:hypothetical protein
MSKKGPTGYAPLLGLLILTLATGVLYATASSSNLHWWYLGGSGGRFSSGGHVLEGTLGQPVVGPATSGDNSLCAGFWCGAQGQYILYLPVVVKESAAGQQTSTHEKVTQAQSEIQREFKPGRIERLLNRRG